MHWMDANHAGFLCSRILQEISMNSQELDTTLIQEAVATAEKWQRRANDLLTDEEKEIQKQMLRLLTHPTDKIVLTKLVDQSFRSRDNRRVADQVSAILKSHGVPDFFSNAEKLLAQMFLGIGRHLPSLSVPKIIDKMRQDSSRTVIAGEAEALHAHLRKRRKEGVRVNINHLGEAVLGEQEAARRLDIYLNDLRDPDIEVVSVKISTIYSQISPLAMERSVAVLAERLAVLYREAQSNCFVRSDGSQVPKMVNLDMEEYRDLETTVAAFVTTLEKPEFKDCMAGMALQAYLPDSYALQQRLTAWARRRVDAGGSPIMLRIVKGANMEMELLESALKNWPLAPYDNKLEVDANYKRMVRFGMTADNARAVHLGIASHNLFELAYAYRTARANGVEKYYHFEMLEGMADHVRRALSEDSEELLLYAPVACRNEFVSAIAYLVRRLDENTAKGNFLRHAPHLTADSKEWRLLRDQFTASCEFLDQAGQSPHRNQDRSTEIFPERLGTLHEGEFTNEPDTDWSLAANRRWAQGIREKWKKKAGDAPVRIPLAVAGREIGDNREQRDCFDPSQLPEKVRTAVYCLAEVQDIDTAVRTARQDPDGWRSLSMDQRHQALSRVAAELREARGDLIGAAAATGKVFTEADVEVSEAVDFAEYYPFAARRFTGIETLRAQGKGVGVVVSPWNFPIAIPCGGLTAALAAGNTVIFKPSSDAVPVAWELCQCFWRAGISRNVLQFVPCSGEGAASHLTSHAGVDFVILTGGTATGMAMLRKHPAMLLSAETGGKNTTIVTAMADRDQAVKNVVYSAFGNGGQKCSATSLLILEKEVYDDAGFKRMLVDAAQSFKTGSCWEFANKTGPLIRPPAGALKRALTSLEPVETWALEPRMIGDNPHLWRPGIKYGVQPGSFTHMTEFFGPLLGVMRADDLEHAVELANQTGYGLTAGLESLDLREQAYWKARLRAGNLYINRGTTGAVTLRQPFGGMGKSALGPAIKAGGPNYVAQFMNFIETAPPRMEVIKEENALLRLALEWRQKVRWGRLQPYAEEVNKAIRAIQSYCYHWEQEFGAEKDYFHIRGQDNIHRYQPLGAIGIRLHAHDSLFDTLARIAAARITGNTAVVSIPEDLHNGVTDFLEGSDGRRLLGPSPVHRHTDENLIAAMEILQRVRYASADRVPEEVLQAAAPRGYYIARAPVLMEGRLELLHYVVNQSVCDNYHRYGNLGDRAEL
jgi:RHH-type transcriptional regulator, proline utilization regulon repressor / proline dehydrogenase / delta 1-pyrroline-5-carboxylate dehydrogenase